MSLKEILIEEGVNPKIAIYVESYLSGMNKKKPYKYKKGFLDLFKPIGGHDKSDVFTDRG